MINQVGGTHYQCLKYQTWDLIRDLNIDYFLGNVIKYISRFKNKNGVEDLLKARSYVQKIINDDINTNLDSGYTDVYVNQFSDDVKNLLILTFSRNYVELLRHIELLIVDMEGYGLK
jgi:hypothetical protein